MALLPWRPVRLHLLPHPKAGPALTSPKEVGRVTTRAGAMQRRNLYFDTDFEHNTGLGVTVDTKFPIGRFLILAKNGFSACFWGHEDEPFD